MPRNRVIHAATLPVRVTKGYQRAPVLGVGTKCLLEWVISYAERAPRPVNERSCEPALKLE